MGKTEEKICAGRVFYVVKKCFMCREAKPISSFREHRKRCLPCESLYDKSRKDPEENSKRCQQYRAKHRDALCEKQRNRLVTDREKIALQRKESRARTMPKILARNKLRQQTKLKATPKWADPKAMEMFYEESFHRKQETGETFHVDHIVPLTSKYVCGLHCEYNLQVISAFDNLSKHNKHWPDMPEIEE